MKNVFILLVALLGFGFVKAEYFITAQYPDIIKYKGKKYNLNSNPLEPFFEKYPTKRPQGGILSTALWRGYVAEFEIIHDQLVLIDIKIEVYDKETKDEYDTKWISAYDHVFPKTKTKKIDWYTGILTIPHGKLVDYVHMGYASTYEKYWLLEIKEGNLKEARFYRHKEYVDFKLRQFREYQKTEQYKAAVDEQKKNDSTLTEEFIETFLFDYLSGYTNKFFVD